MKLSRFFAVACVALLAAACLPVTTKTPVGSTAGLKADATLYGTWIARGPDGGAPAYLHFFSGSNGTMTALMVTPPKDTDSGDWTVYSLQAATLGSNHFLNAQEVMNNGEAPKADEATGIFPILYRAGKDGSVVLYMIDEKAATAAVKAGKLAGTVDPGQDGDVHITADAKKLDAYMQSPQGTALFQKPLLTMTRAK